MERQEQIKWQLQNVNQIAEINQYYLSEIQQNRIIRKSSRCLKFIKNAWRLELENLLSSCCIKEVELIVSYTDSLIDQLLNTLSENRIAA